MNLRIEGGLSGKQLDVTDRNMARVLSTNLSSQADVALHLQRSWTIADTRTGSGAGVFVMYMLNTSTRDVIISRISLDAATSETITLSRVTGTAAGGTAITATNRSLGSAFTQPVTLQGATSITGLTLAGNLEALEGTTQQNLELDKRPIIVSPNAAVAIAVTTGSIATKIYMDFYQQLVDPTVI